MLVEDMGQEGRVRTALGAAARQELLFFTGARHCSSSGLGVLPLYEAETPAVWVGIQIWLFLCPKSGHRANNKTKLVWCG